MGTPEGGKPGVTVPMYSDWRRGTSGGSASMCSVTSSLSDGQGPALQADVPSLSLNVGISCGFIKSGTASSALGDGGLGKRTVAACLRHNVTNISLGLIICLDVFFQYR
ncbi:unnamed protein product [Polarella glacialis]|uniref:Uncharacterized protein n=1 Tax=Polarella glacialis TaxID=89957 RepID=A0A813DLR7_POLGL|nr:unnamed protein product [Polarella glacialis]